MDFEKVTLAEQIKRIANFRGWNMNKLREEYNKKFGTIHIQQSFSKKLIRGAIRYDELKQFGEILGFKVKLEMIDTEE